MDKSSQGATPQQLHTHLFTPIDWLDRLEQRHFSCAHWTPAMAASGTPLHHTLCQLLDSLDPLASCLDWQPLLNTRADARLRNALHHRQHRIAALISALRRQLKQLLQHTSSHIPAEETWDQISELAPELQEQLLRYLPLLEQAFQRQARPDFGLPGFNPEHLAQPSPALTGTLH